MPARPRERRAHRVGQRTARLVARPRPGAGAPRPRPPGSRRGSAPPAGVERRRHHHEPQVRTRAATPGARARARGRRAGCARGTRRARSCGSPTSSGSDCRRAREDALGGHQQPRARSRSAARSEPGSRPPGRASSRAPRRSAGRSSARATRRGWSRKTGPSATSAGGTRVVLPAPGGATSTRARAARAASRRSRPTCASMGRGESIRRSVPMVTRRLRLFGRDGKAGRRERPAA